MKRKILEKMMGDDKIVKADKKEIAKIDKPDEKLKELLDKIRKPFDFLSEDDMSNLDGLLKPELKIKMMTQLYFMDRLDRHDKLRKTIDQVIDKLKELVPKGDLKFKDLVVLVRVLNEVDATQQKAIIPEGSKGSGGNVGETPISLTQFNTKIDSVDNSKRATVIQKFKDMEPSKLEKILRLTESIIKASDKIKP